MFLPHFDVFCNLLLNRRTATWNLFVSDNKEKKIAVSVNTGGHSIRVLNERTVGDGTKFVSSVVDYSQISLT